MKCARSFQSTGDVFASEWAKDKLCEQCHDDETIKREPLLSLSGDVTEWTSPCKLLASDNVVRFHRSSSQFVDERQQQLQAGKPLDWYSPLEQLSAEWTVNSALVRSLTGSLGREQACGQDEETRTKVKLHRESNYSQRAKDRVSKRISIRRAANGPKRMRVSRLSLSSPALSCEPHSPGLDMQSDQKQRQRPQKQQHQHQMGSDLQVDVHVSTKHSAVTIECSPNERTSDCYTTGANINNNTSTVQHVLSRDQSSTASREGQDNVNFNADLHSSLVSQGKCAIQPSSYCQATMQPQQNSPFGTQRESATKLDTRYTPNNQLEANNTSNQLTNRLMLELNSNTNKLVGSYRRLHPNCSGSYKVAKVRPVSGEEQEMGGAQFFHGAEDVNNGNDGNGGTRDKRVERYSRPGKSPHSLQRQTNARLARHKLKIQQQRQEQLARLALRERSQLNQHPSQRLQSEPAASSPESEEAAASSIRPQGTIYTILERLSFVKSSKVPDQQHSQLRNTAPTSGDNRQTYRLELETNHTDGRVLNTLGAIEICDNQLACSSRQVQPYMVSIGSQQATSRTNNQPQRPLSAENVIVFNSINMLRNGSTANQQSAYVNQKADTEDTQTICSTGSTLSLNRPFCKICHIGSSKNGDKLISPCKCSGTMQYIHCGCLLKWLEISNRTNEKPMCCELCAHEYTWRKKFNYQNIKLPKCPLRDIFFHLVFIVAVGCMLFSAIAPMLHKKTFDINPSESTNYKIPTNTERNRHHTPVASYHHSTFNNQANLVNGKIATEEKFMLLCAASFFISFFLAVYVQTKSRDTLYSLVVRFFNMNRTYYITEYDHGQLSNSYSRTNNDNIKQPQQKFKT